MGNALWAGRVWLRGLQAARTSAGALEMQFSPSQIWSEVWGAVRASGEAIFVSLLAAEAAVRAVSGLEEVRCYW